LYDVEPGTVRLADGASPFSATLMAGSADLLAVLGIRPALGRALLPEEHVLRRPSSVMLGHRFWQSHFGGDPGVVGRTLQVGSERRTIVGVLPPEADRFPAGGADVWTAAHLPCLFLSEPARVHRVVGDRPAARRRDDGGGAAGDVDRGRARWPRLPGHQPRARRDPRRPAGRDGRSGQADDAAARRLESRCCLPSPAPTSPTCSWRRRTRAPWSSASARPSAHLPDAWPASCGRKASALFGVAGALGAALAHPIALALIARYPETLPLAADVRIDARVLAMAAACTLAAALLAGLPRTRRLRGAGSRRRSPRRWTQRPDQGHRRMTTLFVAAQVAVSMVLLVSGVLLLRTFMTLTSTTPGFDPDGVVTIRASIPAAARRDPQHRRLSRYAARHRGFAAGRRVGGARDVHPLHGGIWGDGYRRLGTADPQPRGRWRTSTWSAPSTPP
jgi:hypothetical protein